MPNNWPLLARWFFVAGIVCAIGGGIWGVAFYKVLAFIVAGVAIYYVVGFVAASVVGLLCVGVMLVVIGLGCVGEWLVPKSNKAVREESEP